MSLEHDYNALEPDTILQAVESVGHITSGPVSYTHLTLPTICFKCRSRWSPYH